MENAPVAERHKLSVRKWMIIGGVASAALTGLGIGIAEGVFGVPVSGPIGDIGLSLAVGGTGSVVSGTLAESINNHKVASAEA